MVWLTLPALALIGFASLLSLRQKSHRKPQIISHEVEKVPNTNVVRYRITVTKNELPWWSRTLLGGRDYGIKIQPTKCDQLTYIAFQVPRERANYIIAESLFDASNLKGDAVLRTIITWKQSASSTTRDASYILRDTISRQDFK